MRLLRTLTIAAALAAPGLLAGCEPRGDSSGKVASSAPLRAPAAKVAQPAAAKAVPSPQPELACAVPEGGPKVGEVDDGFKIIWTRPAPKPVQGSCHAAFDQLYATRIGLTRDSLAVDLKSDAVRPDDPESQWRGKTLTPKVTLLLDGCPVQAPALLGLLSYGGTEGRMVIRRAQLPQGDLELIFGVFGHEHTVLLNNDGNDLHTIVEEDMKNYVVNVGDPSKGEETTVGYMQPDCSKRGNGTATQGGQP